MAQLKSISAGQISGTGTLSCGSGVFGGATIVADGTNTGTVVIRKDSSSGDIVFQLSTKSPITVYAPYEASGTIYYSITGTGCTAQLHEWRMKKS